MAELSAEVRTQVHRDLQAAISTATAASALLEHDEYTAASLLTDIAAIDAILLRIRRSAVYGS